MGLLLVSRADAFVLLRAFRCVFTTVDPGRLLLCLGGRRQHGQDHGNFFR